MDANDGSAECFARELSQISDEETEVIKSQTHPLEVRDDPGSLLRASDGS